MAISKIITGSLTDDAVTSAKIGTDQVGADALSSSAISGAVDIPANSVGESELSVDYTAQSVPHIVPGVLQPAVAGKLLNGATHSGAYGTAQTQTGGDGHKYYYTDIKGSKPIKDPRIGGHFGSQRCTMRSWQLLEQETAMELYDVYSVDGRDWMRINDMGQGVVYGNNPDGGDGVMWEFNGSGAYLEVTGYFSAVNILWFPHSSGDDFNWKLDGASAGSVSSGVSVSSPLGNRFVNCGSVYNLPFSSPLTTPGIHTIKLVATSGDFVLQGFELIAQDLSGSGSPNRSKIKFPAQNVVSFGKKFEITETNHHYDPFNGFVNGTSLHSAFVDTATSLGLDTAPGNSAKWAISSTNNVRPYNGGRVVKWVDSSGVIKTSVNMLPPNAQNIASSVAGTTEVTTPSATNTTPTPIFSDDAIDYSLSEVAKTFLAREMGNGGANGNASYRDASVANSDHNIAYVLDDGLTSVSAEAVSSYNGTTVGSIGAHNSDFYMYFTFIGSGIGYYGKSNQNNVASNLPYGTHILKIGYDGSNSTIDIDGVQVFSGSANERYYSQYSFNIHQPKKPPIPEDAVVLADYVLMADFVPQTSKGIDKISKGVRRCSVSRDVFCDEIDGNAFSFAQDVSYVSGFRLRLDGGADNADSMKLRIPSFGTNIVHIGYASPTRSQIYIDSSSQTTTDDPDSNSNGSFQSIATNKDLGLYNWGTNAVTGQNGATAGFDIATPIHTSSHYQAFETPFLHELVGGDRNMEQHNLVCSPDGKTWDQITRNTSYLGASLVYLEATIAPYTSYAPSATRGAFHFEFVSKRGTIEKTDMVNKGNWALAYDRLICLVPGQYHIEAMVRIHSGSAQLAIDVRKNGQRIGFSQNGLTTGDKQNYSVFCSADATFKVGDFLQVDQNAVTTNNHYSGEPGECNVRIFKV